MPGYSDPGFDTLALHAGAAPDPATGARAVPIHLTTSFVFESSDHAAALFNLERSGHVYSRISNPTNAVLEERVAALEGGIGAIATASGQAALHLAIATLIGRRLAHRRQHARCTAARTTCCTTRCARFGIETTFVKPGDIDGWRAAIRPETKLLFGETLGNPGLDVLDIPTVARDRARGRPAAAGRLDLHDALPDASPSSYGADLVYHSATKFLSGHGTVIGGVLVDGGSFDWERSGRFAELTAPYDGFHNMVFSEESTVGAFLLRARREGLRDFGACMSPHTAWLILQGIETLPLRMARHVEQHAQGGRVPRRRTPIVARVGYPELESHPEPCAGASSCCRAAAARCSASTCKGSREQGKAFIEALKLFSHLANVGDCRSLVIHPAIDDALPHGRRGAGGAPASRQGTIRLSIGLEDPDDLIDDLKRALKAAEKAGA